MLDPHSAPSAPVPPRVRPGPTPDAAPGRTKSAALLAAASTLLTTLEAGRALSAPVLREALTEAFGATDAEGAWVWKDAYDAAEAALVLFLQRYGRAMRREAGPGPGGPAAMLAMLERLAALEPSQTRRSEEQVRLQQFSTPLPLAYAAVQAATIRPGDRVLEPSAGTGLLAVMAHCALGAGVAGALHLNELAATRAGLLGGLFAGAAVTRHNAEAIADYLPGVSPTVVLMNPPFSASPNVARRRHDADLRHLRSACSMLPPGGRLVAITSANCLPDDTAWTGAFRRLDPPACPVFSIAIDGRAYARHGTSFDTRLTVLDRFAAAEANRAGVPGFDRHASVADAAALLAAVIAGVPPRRPIAVQPVPDAAPRGQRPNRDTLELRPPASPRARAARTRPGPAGTGGRWMNSPTRPVRRSTIQANRRLRRRPPTRTHRGGPQPSGLPGRGPTPRPWCSPPPWPRWPTRRPLTARSCP